MRARARASAGADGTGDGQAANASRLALSLPMLLAGAMILGAAVGFGGTRFAASRAAAARHAALRQALDDIGPPFADLTKRDRAKLGQLGRRAGLDDLRFEAGPADDSGRELQSLHDARGRIIGWLSWSADGAWLQALDRLWLFIGAVGIAVALAALPALYAARQLRAALDRSGEALRRLARQDPLTGLPNRRAMTESLSDALSRRRSGIVVFALVDLDGFREVNDTLGRAGGDAVLINMAEQLRAALPEPALLGRFEADEFAVILPSEDREAATALAAALRAAVQRPIFVERMWQITAGIGIALAPEDGTTGDEIARRAGLALRAAKRDGRGKDRGFAPQIEADYAARRFLLHELETAVALEAFEVHYQPIVAAAGGAIVGAEALLRWTHPSRGPVAPSVFIALAEQSGLMSRLGEIVLRRALADGARWGDLFIAVNLSPVQMRDPSLVDVVGAVMAETGIASSRVVLEVTEGIFIDDPEEARARLAALRALGVRLALDDFGTGFSSLNYLQKFPFDKLKIDRAFVASLGASGNAGAIIQSIVTLGHALGMTVLAEGVETDDQRVLLRLAGCDEMQGFLFAQPAPAAAIDRALARDAGLLGGRKAASA